MRAKRERTEKKLPDEKGERTKKNTALRHITEKGEIFTTYLKITEENSNVRANNKKRALIASP